MSNPQTCAVCARQGRQPPWRAELRVLAVDDEVPVLEELVYLLRADPRILSVEGLSDSTAALRYLHGALDADHALDAVFLDVKMPGFDGLDIARLLSRFAAPPAVVFVTAYEDSAVEAFELKAVDYLLKPVRPERLADALHRVLHAVGDRAEPAPASASVPVPESAPQPVAAPAAEPDLDEAIPVELGGLTRFVKLGDVYFVEAQGDYARLHTPSGNFLIRCPLANLENRWSAAGFARIHRSYLVALRHIEEMRVDDGRLTVRVAGTVLAVSRRHARQLRDLLVRQSRPKPVKGPAG